MYKLYIGDYLKEGTPAAWTIVCQTPKKHLKTHVREIVPILRPGMELYIKHNDEVHAYFREDLRRYFDEKKSSD
jgi:hypothetical protein